MKKIVLICGLLVSYFVSGAFAKEAAQILEVMMYSSPTCGCCESWAKYMEKNGYKVTNKKDNTAYLKAKETYGIDSTMQSCHTAIIEGYVIEGHVPDSAIKALLKDKPKGVKGLSAPGMPQGSPGMEQGFYETYQVYYLLENGESKLYKSFYGDKPTK